MKNKRILAFCRRILGIIVILLLRIILNIWLR